MQGIVPRLLLFRWRLLRVYTWPTLWPAVVRGRLQVRGGGGQNRDSRQLAGIRLAFALGSEALISDLVVLKFNFNPYSVNAYALVAGGRVMT